MVESFTTVEHTYKCELATVTMREETGIVSITLNESFTSKPGAVEEFGKMLCDVAETMRSY